MTDRPPMTRDAKIVTAAQVKERNDERIASLQAAGVGISEITHLFLRLDAFFRLILDDDQWVDLDLAYQEEVTRLLDASEAQAREAAARAKLQMPAGYPPEMNRHGRRHP